jgi:hypothetical protein
MLLERRSPAVLPIVPTDIVGNHERSQVASLAEPPAQAAVQRSRSVARELGRLGGIASGISRRNRSRKQLERSA